MLPNPENIDVSVIVPAYRASETLGPCVESLLGQRFSGRFEVIVVVSADHESQLPALRDDPALTVVPRVPRLGAAAARNLGADVARGDALAFVDADVIARDGWLAALHAAADGDRSGAGADLSDAVGDLCVAGAVANGTPTSVAGTVEYLVEFFDLSPSRTEPSEHGATCNLLVPRGLWETHGPFPEDMDGCEDTWLTTRARAADRLRFAPEAVVEHLNRQRLATVLRHQYELGGSHARLAVFQGTVPTAPLRHGVAATVERIRHLYRMLGHWQAPERARARRLAPLVLAGFCAWGAGLIMESVRIDRRAPK